MTYELTCLRAGCCPAGSINDVVEPELQKTEKVFTRNASLSCRFVLCISELFFCDAVCKSSLLFFLQLHKELRVLAASTSTAMFTWWVWSIFEGFGLTRGTPNVYP